MKYWYHPESHCYFKDNDVSNAGECNELTFEEYSKALLRESIPQINKTKQNKMPKLVKKTVTTKIGIGVGSTVTFDNEGDEVTAKVTEVDGKIATVEDDENVYEVPLKDLTLVEEEDAETPKKKVKGKVVADDDDDDAPKSRSKGKGVSLAKLFNKAEKKEGGGGGIPPGEWDALLVEAGYTVTENGHAAFFQYVGTNSDEEEVFGKSSKKMFFLIDKDGNPNENGWDYFKTDLVTLGFEEELEDEVDSDEMDRILKKIAKKQPWVELNVVPRKDDPRYNNIYVNAMKEDQDDKPDLDDIPY